MGSKKVSMQYFTIEAAEDDYFRKLKDQLVVSMGIFEAGGQVYAYEVLERIDIGGAEACMISVAKRRELWPHIVTEAGEHSELALPEGTLGDIAYCLVCSAHKFIITYGSPGIFRKLFGQFSREGLVRLIPYFEDDIYKKVLLWDCYKKLAFTAHTTTDELREKYARSKAGELTKIGSHLAASKLEVKVSTSGKGVFLSNMLVKELLPLLLEDQQCRSLVVQGCGLNGEQVEQYDLKNAQIKYSETVEFEGNYIMEADIKQIFMRAISARSRMLL